MTENLLLKIEEKVMVLMSEVERLRGDVQGLQRDNMMLKVEREKVEERLKGLVSLFDAVPVAPGVAVGDTIVSALAS